MVIFLNIILLTSAIDHAIERVLAYPNITPDLPANRPMDVIMNYSI